MELIRHNNIKTMRTKKSQIVVKDIEPRDKAKVSIEGGKTSQVPTYDTFISHQDLMMFNCHHIKEL